MLKELTLKNFRKHREQTVNFQGGLTVIRGKSEAGKTTLAEAILYAMFGSSVLRETLAETVTYGEPEASLKVSLTFTFDGVDYKIVRGKSGAELHYADQSVTGQRETKVFVERLLGCSSDTARLLMFADQNAIRGVLAKGGTAANGLVETLAQLGLIEGLVDAIQRDLPSGNTKALDAQIEVLKAATLEVPPEPSKDEATALTVEISTFREKIDLAEQAAANDLEVGEARLRVQAQKAVEAEVSRLEKVKTQITANLARTVTPPFDFSVLESARLAAAGVKEQQRRMKAFKTKFPTCEATWDEGYEAALVFKKDRESVKTEMFSNLADLKLHLNTLAMKRINEKTCAFCKKDLTDVPEVAAINNAVSLEEARTELELKTLQEQHAEVVAELAAINKILEVTAQCRNLAGDYWELDESVLPPKAKWIGAEPVEPQSVDLPKLEKAWADYQGELSRRELLQEQLAEIVLPVLRDVTADLAMIAKHEEAKAELQKLQLELGAKKLELSKAEASFKAQTQARENIIQRNEDNKRAVEQLEATRQGVLKHNELIKKLRAARPEIASKMWGSVLGAVSKYFTQIRGEDSVVIRDSDGFKVNGRSVEGLSGSTQDMLGLAIRMALSKLFLPNLSFLMLDESFSACDDNRELNGVSTLAAAGFTQVILITHSDAPETIADNLITL